MVPAVDRLLSFVITERSPFALSAARPLPRGNGLGESRIPWASRRLAAGGGAEK